MHLGGRFLYIMRGLPGSRRDEISDLIAAGIAYTSTLAEYKGEVVEGIHHIEGSKLERHAPVIVISSDDCFWDWEDRDGDKHRIFNYDQSRQTEAEQDSLRRCRAAMRKGINHVVVNNENLVEDQMSQYLALAVEFEYEVIPVSIPDFRHSVILKRLAQSKKIALGAVTKIRDNNSSLPTLQDHDPLPLADFVNEDPIYDLIQPPTEAEEDEPEEQKDSYLCIEITGFLQGSENAYRFLKRVNGAGLLTSKKVYDEVEKSKGKHFIEINATERGLDKAKLEKIAEDYGVEFSWR